MLNVPNLVKSKKPKRLTRRDDAASIVGEQLANELEKRSKAINSRSYHALIEMSDTLPYGGAITLAEAQAYLQRTQAKYRALDALSIFTAIVQNILERDDVLDKQAALENAVDDFKSAISAEVMLSVFSRSGVKVGKPEKLIIHKESYPQGLSVKSAVAKSLGSQPKPAEQYIGIKRIVRDSVGLAQHDQRQEASKWVHAQILKGMNLDLSDFNPNSNKNIIRKSVDLRAVSEKEVKPMSVRQIARQSVGLPVEYEPPKPAIMQVEIPMVASRNRQLDQPS